VKTLLNRLFRRTPRTVRHPKPADRVRLAVHPLEDRVVMNGAISTYNPGAIQNAIDHSNAGVTATLDQSDSVLRVFGREVADQIRVVRSDGEVRVPNVNVRVFNGASAFDAASINWNSVSRVDVYALGGNDTVSVEDYAPYYMVPLGAKVYGGEGDDTIAGGNGDDVLVGGGTRLIQTGGQLGGVYQVLPGVLPGGAATTFVRFGSGDVYAWDGSGVRLHQSGSQLGGVRQLLSGVDPSTGQSTTYVRFGSGDVYTWDARGARRLQGGGQRGGGQEF
jgi:hypothetical protein